MSDHVWPAPGHHHHAVSWVHSHIYHGNVLGHRMNLLDLAYTCFGCNLLVSGLSAMIWHETGCCPLRQGWSQADLQQQLGAGQLSEVMTTEASLDWQWPGTGWCPKGLMGDSVTLCHSVSMSSAGGWSPHEEEGIRSDSMTDNQDNIIR